VSVLPRISGRDVVKALTRIGYEEDRQRGSHIILRQSSYPHRRITGSESQRNSKGNIESCYS